MALNSMHHSEAVASTLHSEGGFGRTLFNIAIGAAIVAGGIYVLFHGFPAFDPLLHR